MRIKPSQPRVQHDVRARCVYLVEGGHVADSWKAKDRNAAGEMRLVSNITANALSRLWLALVQVAVTPVIVHLLGPSSYGLIALYMTLLLSLIFLDQCASPVLSRFLAQFGTPAAPAINVRDLLRTMEFVTWSTGLCIGGSIIIFAPWIARNWIGTSLPHSQLVDCLRLIGVGIALQWPSFLYASGFVGLQRQDILQLVRAILLTVQAGGAVLVLIKSATPEAYLLWQSATNAVISVTLGVLLWRILPSTAGRARINWGLIEHIWRFAAGNFAIGFLAAIVAQAGPLIVAKFCTLEQFAAYALATTLVAQVSTMLTQPISTALMPHFVKLLSAPHHLLLAEEYHRWSQRIVILVLPVSATLIVFARPLMDLWLGTSSPLAAPVAALLPWLAVGTLFNTLVTPPYVVQIAAGWTRLTVVTALVAVCAAIPFLLVSVPNYGPLAAAICWAAINIGSFTFSVPQMHKRLLPNELRRWWVRDTGLPLLIAAASSFVASEFVPSEPLTRWSLIYAVAFATGTAALVAVALPYVRTDIKAALRLMRDRT